MHPACYCTIIPRAFSGLWPAGKRKKKKELTGDSFADREGPTFYFMRGPRLEEDSPLILIPHVSEAGFDP